MRVVIETCTKNKDVHFLGLLKKKVFNVQERTQ